MIVLEAMVALTADSMLEDFTSMNLAMQHRGPVRHLGPCACAGAVGLLGPLSQGEVVPLVHRPPSSLTLLAFSYGQVVVLRLKQI